MADLLIRADTRRYLATPRTPQQPVFRTSQQVIRAHPNTRTFEGKQTVRRSPLHAEFFSMLLCTAGCFFGGISSVAPCDGPAGTTKAANAQPKRIAMEPWPVLPYGFNLAADEVSATAEGTKISIQHLSASWMQVAAVAKQSTDKGDHALQDSNDLDSLAELCLVNPYASSDATAFDSGANSKLAYRSAATRAGAPITTPSAGAAAAAAPLPKDPASQVSVQLQDWVLQWE